MQASPQRGSQTNEAGTESHCRMRILDTGDCANGSTQPATIAHFIYMRLLHHIRNTP